jgi:hypothetical protein
VPTLDHVVESFHAPASPSTSAVGHELEEPSPGLVLAIPMSSIVSASLPIDPFDSARLAGATLALDQAT